MEGYGKHEQNGAATKAQGKLRGGCLGAKQRRRSYHEVRASFHAFLTFDPLTIHARNITEVQRKAASWTSFCGKVQVVIKRGTRVFLSFPTVEMKSSA